MISDGKGNSWIAQGDITLSRCLDSEACHRGLSGCCEVEGREGYALDKRMLTRKRAQGLRMNSVVLLHLMGFELLAVWYHRT